MTRVKGGPKRTRRRKKLLKLAKGFRGTRKSLLSVASHVVARSLVYAYRDRKTKKREFRSLWILRINAACRTLGIKYSQLIHGLKKANVKLDRSVLANLANTDPKSFETVVIKAKEALGLS